MLILDTNVVSELFRPSPDRHVDAWFRNSSLSDIFITSITKAEVLAGLALMPDGRQVSRLHALIHFFLGQQLQNPILSFGSRDAEFFAELVAARRRLGRPIGQFDAQIAAIARQRDFSVVTRNVRDFMDCGVRIFNPWESRPA